MCQNLVTTLSSFASNRSAPGWPIPVIADAKCPIPITRFDAMLLVMQPDGMWRHTCPLYTLHPSSASTRSGTNTAHTCGGRCQVSYAFSQNGPREQREQRNKAAAVVGAVGEPKSNNKQHHPGHDEQAKASWNCCAAVPQEGAARTDIAVISAAGLSSNSTGSAFTTPA